MSEHGRKAQKKGAVILHRKITVALFSYTGSTKKIASKTYVAHARNIMARAGSVSLPAYLPAS
jgi:hypothetical protein